MILTTKGKYAVMAVIDLIDEGKNLGCKKNPVSLLSISQRQNISLSYLEQIFTNLRKADIVSSIKGPGGGYVLKKPAEKITVFEIIKATGENIKMTNCGNKALDSCSFGTKKLNAKCKTHHLWNGLEKTIQNYLNSISLFDICKNAKNH